MVYLWLKLIHIISATILFGTGLGTAFFMFCAHLTRSTETIAKTTRTVILADWIFTTPAVLIQPLTGFWMIALGYFPIQANWLIITYFLYIIIGSCWIPVVYLQIKMNALAQEALKNKQDIMDNQQYRKYFKLWFVLGWPAFIMVLIIFYLMVLKPNF